MTSAAIPYLSRDDVDARLDYPDLIDAMRSALIAFSAGEVVQPVRQFIDIEPVGGFFGLMPAVHEAIGVKLVSFFPENAAAGLHTHHALVAVFDRTTGAPTAVLDGGLITEMRTAAVSAAATDLLATPDAHRLAILGTGVQAEAHLEALRCVRDIDEVLVWGRTPEHAASFAERHDATSVSARDAVEAADIVVTATAATEPILRGAWLPDGCHVNAVGWNGADGRELDDEAMGNAVFVESRLAAADQAGNCRGSGATITAEIGEALQRDDRSWRDRTTVFDSVGMAVEDVAAASLALASHPS